MIHELLDASAVLHVSAAGAGLELCSALWRTPGASRYLSGIELPYAHGELEWCLEHPWQGSSVSEAVACDLAIHAYVKAAQHCQKEGKGRAMGLGITAAVASNRMPRGRQRAHLVAISPSGVFGTELQLLKGQGLAKRVAHDRQVFFAASSVVTSACRSNANGDVDLEQRMRQRLIKYPVFSSGARELASQAQCYVPATLDPIHQGHIELRKAAETHLDGARARYLVAVDPPHKPPATVAELLDKVASVRLYDPEAAIEFSTGEPLFIDKARQRGGVYAIGADALLRLLDPRWGPEVESMLRDFKNLGTRFLVRGRKIGERFVTCRDVQVPWPHGNLFEPLEGRCDASSSALRRAN